MHFLKRFFSSKSKSYNVINEIMEDDRKIKQMSLDEQFVHHFIKKGGKFFYPDDMDDFKLELLTLLQYLKIPHFTVLERSYYHFLQKLEVPVTLEEINQNGALLGGCESLIAEEGAIMTTAIHTKEYRNDELPKKRVIIALSNQIIPNKRAALININKQYEKPPSNIQTMSIFAPPKDDLSGGKWYETYLFLIEN